MACGECTDDGDERVHYLDLQRLSLWPHPYDNGIAEMMSRELCKCPGTRCLISSKAHRVSESRPPENCR